MTERPTVALALIAAELASLALVPFVPSGSALELASPSAFATQHASIVLCFWTVFVLCTWLFAPATWRPRQHLRTKFRFFAVLCTVNLLAEAAACLALTLLPPGSPGAADQNLSALPLFLLAQSAAAVAAFALTVFVCHTFRRRSHVTPPPLFGRD